MALVNVLSESTQKEIAATLQQAQATLATLQALVQRADRVLVRLERIADAVTSLGPSEP